MRCISIDPLSGAAGDMILAALFDLGADPASVQRDLQECGLNVTLQFKRALCPHGLTCGYLRVIDNDHPDCHDHEAHDECEHHHHEDMGEHHHHEETCEHHHHHHENEGENHHHVHRGLSDILAMLAKSSAPVRAKERAAAIFRRLGEAEAAIHGKTVEEIHFHEVGAVDSIADIFGICLALEQLDIEHIYCAGYKIGQGTVRCAHGVMPVPAPATARLLEGQMVTRLPIQSELTTPTGAAVLVTLSEGTLPAIPFQLQGTGYGHGAKNFELMPNVVRALLFETPAENKLSTDTICELRCEIDDQTPETLGNVQELLLASGALDVCFSSTQMKKNRPAVTLQVLCHPQDDSRFASLILEHTSSIGVRVAERRRYLLKREKTTVETPWGPVAAKAIHRPGGAIEIVPEYDSAREVATAAGLPLRQVMAAVHNWKTQP